MADLISAVHGEISFSYDSRGVLQARNSIGDLVDTADLADTRMNRLILRLRSMGGLFTRVATGIRSGLGRVLPSLSSAFGTLAGRFPRITSALSILGGRFTALRGRMSTLGPLFRAFGAALAPIARGVARVGSMIGSGLASAGRAAGAALGAIGGALGSVLKAAGPVLPIVAALGALPAIAAGASAAFGGMAAAAGAIGAAGLAALPAAIFAAGGAALVLKLAFQGVGDAVKAAFSGDTAKFDEAIKKLAPNAQQAAKALQSSVVPAVKSLQQNIQQVAFTGLAPQIASFGEGLRELKNESGGLAAALNVVLGRVLTFANSTTFLNTAGQAMLFMKNVLHNIGEGIGPLLTGFAQLAGNVFALGKSAGSFEGLAGAMTRAGEAMGRLDVGAIFGKLGNLAAPFEPLLDLLKDIGTIASSVFGALAEAGASAGGGIGAVISAIADFTKTEAGKAALDALAQALAALGGGIGQAVMSLLTAMAPAIVALAPIVTLLARIVGDVLATAFTAISPLLTAVAQILAAVLVPILPVLGQLLNVVAQVIGQLLTTALAALMPALMPVIGLLVQLLTAILPPLVPLFTAVGAVLNFLVGVIAGVIGWVVQIVTAFIKWTGILDIVSGFVKGVIKFFTDLFNKLVGHSIVPDLINGVFNFFQRLSELPGKVWAFLRGLIEKFIQMNIEIFNTVRELPGKILNALGNLGNLLVGAGRDVIDGLFRGISEMAGKVLDKAREIANKIKDTITGALGISSPSKVMIELGKFTGEGLALGLGASAEMIRRAAMSAAANIVMPVQAMATTAPTIGRTAAPASNTTVYNANQTVNALPGQSAREVGDASMRRLMFTLKNGA